MESLTSTFNNASAQSYQTGILWLALFWLLIADEDHDLENDRKKREAERKRLTAPAARKPRPPAP